MSSNKRTKITLFGEKYSEYRKLIAAICMEAGFSLQEVRMYRKALREVTLEHTFISINAATNNTSNLDMAFLWSRTTKGHTFWAILASKLTGRLLV